MSVALAAMSLDTYQWARVAHILGFTLWIAGLVAVYSLLRAHAAATGDGRAQLAGATRAMGMMMEAGATLAIGFGLWLAFASPMFPTNAFASGGWLHVKLVAVVALIGMHGLLRMRMKAYREGQNPTLPGWILSVIVACAAIAIALGANQLLLRK